MPKAVLSDEQMAQLEAQHTPDAKPVLSDDDMAKLEAHHAQQGRMDTPSWVPGIVKNAASALAAKQAGMVNSATLGYGNLEDIPVVGKAFKQASQESPIARAYGGVEGSFAPGAGMGALAGKAASLYNNPVGRTAAGAAAGGLEGLLRKPSAGESRLGNAATGARNSALIGGGMEVISGLAGPTSKLAQWLGQKLGGINSDEASAYIRNPEQSEKYAKMLKEDPKGLSDAVRQKIGGGLEETFDNVSRPALSEVESAVTGKSVQVRPDQFTGSAAEPEINRAWNLRDPQRSAQYSEVTPYEAKATPVQEKLEFGTPETQTAFLKNRPYDSPEVPVQTVSRRLVKAGPEEVVIRGYTPGELKSAPTDPRPVPDVMSIEGTQALRAKRAAQKAASYKQALNPQGYRAADDAEAQAGRRLKQGLEGAAPGIADANATLEEAARYSGAARAKFANNPAAILTDSESAGSVPTRAMRQFIDKHGNAGLEDMANQLSSGTALGAPSTPESVWGAAKRYGAKAALGASRNASSVKTNAQDMALRALLGANANGASEAQDPELAEYEQYLRETGQK